MFLWYHLNPMYRSFLKNPFLLKFRSFLKNPFLPMYH
jgi:hypothetical protein